MCNYFGELRDKIIDQYITIKIGKCLKTKKYVSNLVCRGCNDYCKNK